METMMKKTERERKQRIQAGYQNEINRERISEDPGNGGHPSQNAHPAASESTTPNYNHHKHGKGHFRERKISYRFLKSSEKQGTVMASWAASLLLWIPFFAWLLWSSTEMPLEMEGDNRFLVLVIITTACFFTGHLSFVDAKYLELLQSLGVGIAFIAAGTTYHEAVRLDLSLPFGTTMPGMMIALFIYFLLVGTLSIMGGRISFALALGTTGGFAAGITLFKLGGGAAESTLVSAAIISFLQKLNGVESGMSFGTGATLGILTGFSMLSLTQIISSEFLLVSAQNVTIAIGAAMAIILIHLLYLWLFRKYAEPLIRL